MLHQGAGVVDVGQRGGFQHFQNESLSDRCLVPVDQCSQSLGEQGFLQVARGDIDAERQIQSQALPLRQLFNALLHHPVTYLGTERAVFYQGQELGGRNHTMLRVAPPQECFHAQHTARAHVDLGLKVQNELVAVQGFLHARNGLKLSFGAPVVLRVKEQVAIAPRLFGAVHGMVGVTHQRVGVHMVQRVHGGANAGGHHHRRHTETQGVGFSQVAQYAFDGLAALFNGGCAQQENEFVTTESRDRITATGPVAHGAAQSIC